MQTIALAMFAVVLIIAAISYVLENFRIMGEGTAANIVTSSVFTLILIFACQYIYNAAAGVINILVGWSDVGGSGLLIPSGNVVNTIVGYATGGIGTVSLPNLDPFTGFFFSGILIMLVASLLMLTLVMGLTRLFFTGVLAAVLPLLLVLRLIPFTKHFADTLIQDLTGFMFASIMSSVVLLFGYQVLTSANLNPLTQILVAIITLFAAAYMSTVFAGKFGSLGMSAAHMVGGAVTSGLGMALGTVGGAVIGGGAGAAGRLSNIAGQGLSKSELLGQASEGFASGAASGAVAGFLSGGIGVGGGRIGMGTMVGMRGMSKTITNSIASQHAQAQEFLSNRAGSTLNSVLYKNSVGDVLPTATPQSSAHFISDLDKKSSEEVYNGYVAGNYPELAANIKDTRTAGLEVKRHLQSLPPEVAHSNWQRAQNQGSLQKEARLAFYQNAQDETGENRETVTAIQKGIHIPNLEVLDTSPRFAIDTFNVGTVTTKGSIANAKIFNGIKQLGITENRQENNLIAETEFRKASPESLGAQLALISGVTMTPKEQKTYGYAMAKVRSVVTKQNPTLAANMAYYTMGNGRNQFIPLMNDEKFTAQAVKDMESHNTSAWLANTLNVKQTKTFDTENLFKNQPNTNIANAAKASIENLSTNQITTSTQPKNKPIDLLELQKRYREEGY